MAGETNIESEIENPRAKVPFDYDHLAFTGKEVTDQ